MRVWDVGFGRLGWISGLERGAMGIGARILVVVASCVVGLDLGKSRDASVSGTFFGARAVGDTLSECGGPGTGGGAATGAGGTVHTGDGRDRGRRASAGSAAESEPGVPDYAGDFDGRGTGVER